MELSNLIPHIEALIFASDKPLSSAEITELINNAFAFMEDKITAEQVDAAVEGIVEKYSSEFYPFSVRQSGGGWQFLTKKEFHKTVAQLNGEKFLKKLSAAALETLAIIAYKQPITKGEIEQIRGVSSDYTVQKLLEKELIIITGRNEDMPGHPLVYATSKNFMDYFGLNSPDELPKIREVMADQLVEPTLVKNTLFEEEGSHLVVTDEGELVETDEAQTEAADQDGAAEDGARLFIAGFEKGEEDAPLEATDSDVTEESAPESESSPETPSEDNSDNDNPSADKEEDEPSSEDDPY